MSEQLSLFGQERPEPLPAPTGQGKAKTAHWASLGRTTRQRCDDCAQVAYDRLRDGHMGTLGIRQARYSCVIGEQRLYLCHEHARQRQLPGGK